MTLAKHTNYSQTTTNKNKNVDVVYLAGGDDEADDQSYLQSIQQKFPNIVKTISIHEKDGRISSQYVRDTILFLLIS